MGRAPGTRNPKTAKETLKISLYSEGILRRARFAKSGRQNFPCVEVRGAGVAEANGWYRRREHSEGPPCFLGTVGRWGHPSWIWSQSVWDREYKGQYWYENIHGYFIFLDVTEQGEDLYWKIRSNRDVSLYLCRPHLPLSKKIWEKIPPTHR